LLVEQQHSAKGLAQHIVLIVSVLVLDVLVAQPPPALAACDPNVHQNVEGTNNGNINVFGNRGGIFVNSGINYPALNDSIHRSLFVIGSAGNDVEIGWTANNGVHTAPVSYTEWVNRGVDSGIKFEQSVSIGSTPNFRVQDGDGNSLWTFFVGT
jgi:hypothetical protein